ncbi:MAG: DUF4365 domain-containing protein [Planctomycetes bacterium]|nr:DUF4365 domain-containing protein [Planctomycetota bacterium]
MAAKRPRQHEIDKRARGILCEIIASWASTNAHEEDYGIDYTAEVFTSNTSGSKDASGIEFSIQLKGTEVPKYIGSELVFAFDTKALSHLVEHKRLPVFLIVVDVKKRDGYYLFLQEYVSRMASMEWRTRKSITLRLPISNTICDCRGFEKSVRDADARMPFLRPGGIAGAIRAEKARLELLDRRVSVNILADSNGSRFEISPKHDLSGTIQISGKPPKVKEAVSRLIHQGLAISPEEFQVSVRVDGLPLVVGANQPIERLQICRKVSGTVRLSLYRELGEIGSIEIDGTWTGGTKEMALVGSFPRNIFTVNARACEHNDNSVVFQFNFSFDISSWLNRPLLSGLEHFDRLFRVFGNAQPKDIFRIEVMVDGNTRAINSTCFDEFPWGQQLAVVLKTISNAMEISRTLGEAISLIGPLSEQQIDEIEYVYSLLKNGEAPIHVAGPLSTTHDQVQQLRVGAVREGRLELHQSSHFVSVLGRSINIGPATIILDTVQLRVHAIETIGSGHAVTWDIVRVGRTSVRRSSTAAK